MVNAAIYARRSHRRNCENSADNPQERLRDEESVSIPQQLEDGRQLAHNRGWRIEQSHIFTDEGKSGKLLPTCWASEKAQSREGLSGLLKAVERGEVQVVIIR